MTELREHQGESVLDDGGEVRDRARVVVKAALGVDREEERRLLGESGGGVVDREEAAECFSDFDARARDPRHVDEMAFGVNVVLHALDFDLDVGSSEQTEVTAAHAHLAVAGQPTFGSSPHRKHSNDENGLLPEGDGGVTLLPRRPVSDLRFPKKVQHAQQHVDRETVFPVDV
eukprot:CAMPEP_0181295114 /NCGR_PEP_ID=MMETSP1101-20121128/3967_1 /TAXON_ID=46948 /ORGANISM="Rhodomonas abbreviata, Strain Caron Lab Isolate" /LENGTH=172 /DNA_ID=CAMNT_0023399829 /DNA_START=299 /DNA_END=817 /DNA_ORIENTATION=-